MRLTDRSSAARLSRTAAIAALARALAAVDAGARDEAAKHRDAPYEATAYSDAGKTAQGTHTHDGVVAADPALLPLGTRIRVRDAGRYSGEYVVRDTGHEVKGRKIDIYIPNDAEAKRFGHKSVHVEVVDFGDNRRKPQ